MSDGCSNNKHVIPDSISYPNFYFYYKGKVFIYDVEKDNKIKLLLAFVYYSDINEETYESLALKWLKLIFFY